MLERNMIVDNTYQILEEIGSGGMGVIYLAYHLRLEKYIVLKKIKNPYVNTSLLRNEVDILKDLHHPFLPQVYDFIEYNGNLYTVIDYKDGCDLNEYINSGYTFSEGQLIKWLRQLCEVLNYLHSQTPRILHTDIKPANIIITGSGDVCLIDFGISLYNTDVIKGLSENYSSPEQYGNFYYLQYGEGSYFNLDERTDIYSLGATFYHLMTGVCPDIVNGGYPPITEYELPYSEAFIAVIAKSMNYHPENRFAGAKEMLKAIDNMRKHDMRYKKYVLIQVASSLIAVILIVTGVVLAVNGYRNSVASRFEEAYRSFISLTNRGDIASAVEAGQNLINNPSYNGLTNDSVKAQILHKIADCYADDDDNYNAAYFYNEALNYDQNELMYRDYAIALIDDGQTEKATELLSELQDEYGSSIALAVANARLCYGNGDYERAVEMVDSEKISMGSDAENIYAANIIKGDACIRLLRYEEAIEAYKQALTVKNTLNSKRKLGNAYLLLANKNNNNSAYRNALQCFDEIIRDYTANVDDIINYSQLCIFCDESNKYSNCQKMLIEAAESTGDCRCYILLSLVSHRLNNNRTAGDLLEAHRRYEKLTEEERALISSEVMKEIRSLYKTYCGQDW